MVVTPSWEHTVLQSGETTVVVEYDAHGHARLDVTAHGYGRGSAEAGLLVREAIHQARLRHASHVEGGLDASGPTCGAVLEALHRSIGDDLESIAMRRAGASVLVALDLRPLPPAPAPDTIALLPTQPTRRPHPAAETPLRDLRADPTLAAAVGPAPAP